MMIWLDFVSMILILGFEINVSIDTVTKRLTRKTAQTAEKATSAAA
ncbi:hypothetical protein [Pontibacter sp. BAB1700]|nr:hypothetical protein [Pontibacter sp. BAB1700]